MRILIIKVGALGDVIRTSFIAQALKDKYYKFNPEIYWVTSNVAKALFVNNPYVDKIVTGDKRDFLRKIKFDLIINLEEDLENCQFTTDFPGAKKIGFLYKNGKYFPSKTAKEWFDMSLRGKKPQNDILKSNNKKPHRQLIGELVGVNWKKYEPFLRLNEGQREIVGDFLRRYNLSRNDLIIGMNLGSSDRWPKALPVKKTAKLIDKIYKKYKAKILLFGGPGELDRNREILKIAKSQIIDTGCGNDLLEFPALLSVCNIVLSSDSMGLHASLALKRKTIALIGPTLPNEIETYDIGGKIIAKSKDVGTLKTKSDAMDKIDLDEVVDKIDELIGQKITLVITAFKEPKTIGRAVEAALNQKTGYKYEIIVSAPDDETLNVVRKYKGVKIFKDSGKGKTLALNLIFKEIDSDIMILTDGDVFISNNAVEEICNLFLDPEIGCLSGRPIPMENRKTKYGYWANFLFDAAHHLRREAFEKNSFLECSGYLFAFRKSKIKQIPLDVPEDTIIPYHFWEKGYRIGYAENAKVYVRNVNNWKEWISQKSRTSSAHENVPRYVNTEITPKVKTFRNEVKGISNLMKYPKTLQENLWTFELVLARLYMWIKVFSDMKFKKKFHTDNWKRVESTK